MASPHDILVLIRDELEGDSNIPDSVSYILREVDGDGIDGNITLPVIQIQAVTATNFDIFNTDVSGTKQDGSGNDIGRFFRSEYQLRVQIDVVTVDRRSDSNEHIDYLADTVRRSLYRFDSAGLANELDTDVWRFILDTGSRTDDMTTTPTMRRWQQDVLVWTYETYETTEEYIKDFAITATADYQ